MSALVAMVERYLRDTLGESPRIIPWEQSRQLPLFLRDRYRFYKANILNTACLLMADSRGHEETPSVIRKHVDQVRTKWDGPVIYVREGVAAYNRKRLVEHKIPFVVPGNQMYLPMVGIDFREHFRKSKPETRGLRPSSQAVLIDAILRHAEDLSPTVLARRLGYSVMAMCRALDELEAAGIGESSCRGRGSNRRLHFKMSMPEVWERAKPLLKTPVKVRHSIQAMPGGSLPGPQAGLSALAHYSMLAEPETVTIALSRQEWKSLQEQGTLKTTVAGEPGAMTVEVWSYPPALFARDGFVDRLSLYLSLRDTQDERVRAALEEMMREITW